MIHMFAWQVVYRDPRKQYKTRVLRNICKVVDQADETNSYILCEAIHNSQITNISNRSVWHVCLWN